jgi:uncharacterized DUF497 family protein
MAELRTIDIRTMAIRTTAFRTGDKAGIRMIDLRTATEKEVNKLLPSKCIR